MSEHTATALLLRIRQARQELLAAASRSEQRDLAVDIASDVADLDDLMTRHGAGLPGPWDPALRAAYLAVRARTVPGCDIVGCAAPATRLETSTLGGTRTLAFLCDRDAAARNADGAGDAVFGPLVTEAMTLTTLPASQVVPGMQTWQVPDNPVWPEVAWRWVLLATESYRDAGGDLRVRWVYQDGRVQDFGYYQPVAGYFQPGEVTA